MRKVKLQVFTVKDAAKELSLSIASIRRAARSDKLKSFYGTVSGSYRRQLLFSRDELKRFVRSWPRVGVKPAPAAAIEQDPADTSEQLAAVGESQ